MHVIDNITTYLSVHVMWPIFLSHFKQTWIFSTDFYEVQNTEFHGNPSWDPRWYMRTNRTDRANRRFARTLLKWPPKLKRCSRVVFNIGSRIKTARKETDLQVPRPRNIHSSIAQEKAGPVVWTHGDSQNSSYKVTNPTDTAVHPILEKQHYTKFMEAFRNRLNP